jgi:hypothetical protein
MVEGDLYQRGANDILLRCITREDGCKLLAEIHGGEYDNHASFRTLVVKPLCMAFISLQPFRMPLSW